MLFIVHLAYSNAAQSMANNKICSTAINNVTNALKSSYFLENENVFTHNVFNILR